jgi:hypothetical protein
MNPIERIYLGIGAIAAGYVSYKTGAPVLEIAKTTHDMPGLVELAFEPYSWYSLSSLVVGGYSAREATKGLVKLTKDCVSRTGASRPSSPIQ